MFVFRKEIRPPYRTYSVLFFVRKRSRKKYRTGSSRGQSRKCRVIYLLYNSKTILNDIQNEVDDINLNVYSDTRRIRYDNIRAD